MDFDATSLYLFARWDENSVSPKMETGFSFKSYMKNVYVEAFNIQTYKPDVNESAILKLKNCKPPDLLFHYLPVTGKVKNIEVSCMRNGYMIDTLTSVDIQEIVKKGGKMIRIYEGAIYQENFKTSSFGKFIEKLFALREKYEDERNDLM